MPVLVLLISLFGNYLIFQKTGTLDEYNLEHTISEVVYTPLPLDSSVSSLYFNTSLSDDEVISIFNNSGFIDNPNFYVSDLSSMLGSDIYKYTISFASPVSSDYDRFLYLVYLDYSVESPLLASYNIPLGSYYTLLFLDDFNYYQSWCNNSYCSLILNLLMSWDVPASWRTDVSYFDVSSFVCTSSSFDINTNLVNLVSLTSFDPVDVSSSFVGSLFDKTLIDTSNTFAYFEMPFIKDIFISLFNVLGFSKSYISNFVCITFTWMLQFLLLHVVVDTLAFIFKMYHKLMDKVV